MRHGILGPGGIGGLIGAVLAKSGEAVTVIVHPEMVAEFPHSLSLDSKFGRFSVPIDVVSTVDQPLDFLWISVKATQLKSALRNVSLTTNATSIIPLLNGIDHINFLRTRFGHDRVVPATIAVESEKVAPGHIVHRSPFARINIGASGRDRLEASVRQFREFGFECNFVESESILMWSKLVFLAPWALATTAAEASIGEVLADPTRSLLLEGCVREACMVAKENGATLNSEKIIDAIKALPPQMRSSMQKDLQAGRTLELDAIAGPILRGAEVHRISLPNTKSLIAAIEAKLQRLVPGD